MPVRTPVVPTILVLTILTAAAPPATAAPPPLVPVQAQQTDPGGADGRSLPDLQALLKALEGWIKRFPTYSAPEVLPNGDIIIRRHPPDPPPRKPAATVGGTET